MRHDFRIVTNPLKFFISLAVLTTVMTPTLCNAGAGDVVFVTQVPMYQDFANIVATFGNQSPNIEEAPRGGDLYIRYSNGTLKNLTQAAGYGTSGLQGDNAIAVRDPCVNWEGNKVLFSMVVGGARQQYDYRSYRWQLYEVTGLGSSDTPVISKVANQPSDYNNIMGCYGSDDSIIFSTDRPRNGATHLYPQRDEYESTATNTGLWKLNPTSGSLTLLDHAPSGAFHPIVDSFGRIIYTRWDHLQRDQQNIPNSSYLAINFSSEASTAQTVESALEVFPEPRGMSDRSGNPDELKLNLHTFNHFLPWMIHQDGTGHETLNHIGRQELASYINNSFNDDPNLEEFYDTSQRFNQTEADNIFHLREDPNTPGLYFGISAPEFGTHTSGQVVTLNGPPGLAADQMALSYITHPDTAGYTSNPSSNHTGLYRNVFPLSSGVKIVSHTTNTREDGNVGTSSVPLSRYDFRLKQLTQNGSYWQAGTALTSGISKSLSYWTPDSLISFSGNLWELQPVELVARSRPASSTEPLHTIEQGVFEQEGVSIAEFKSYLIENNLALIVSRNVTTRDSAEKQQPFNLRVTDTSTQTLGASGKIYDVSFLQIFQGDLIRGYDSEGSGSGGRRVLAQPMHDGHDKNPTSTGPSGSVELGSDGSFAAFVPAQRALTWQLNDPDGKGVVRERLWLTFQPGEIRLCGSCHGINSTSQAGNGAPENAPEALRTILSHWRGLPIPTSPQYSLSVAASAKKKTRGLINGSARASVSVKGKNETAANKTLKLLLSVNGTACANPLEEFITDSSGNYKLSSKFPDPRAKAATLAFKLSRGGSVLATASTKLQPMKAKYKNKKMTPAEKTRLCNALLSLQ